MGMRGFIVPGMKFLLSKCLNQRAAVDDVAFEPDENAAIDFDYFNLNSNASRTQVKEKCK